MTTFSELLQAAYEETPDRPAIVLQEAGKPDLELSYRTLLEGANAFAIVLAGAEVRPGEVVVIILQHGRDLVCAYWGAILHGAVPSIMPFLTEKLAPERYLADLAALVEVTRPAAIITYSEFEAEVRGTIAPSTSTGRGQTKIVMDRQGRAIALISTEGLIASEQPDFRSLPGLHRQPNDIALLQHSSGTTGLQKGVALTHAAVLNQIGCYAKALSLDPRSDVIVSWLPLYHDMGLIASFILPILLRIPLILMSPFDWVRAPYRLMQAVSRYRGTLTWLPNFAFNLCARTVRPRQMEGVTLESWRAVINCSEPVSAASHAAFYGALGPYGLRPACLQTCYAMAENVFAVTQSQLGSEPWTIVVDSAAFISERIIRPIAPNLPGLTLMSSGKVLENVELRVIDGTGRELPPGEVGELVLRSDCMLSEYYNRPEETAKAFLEGWYLTGDYGFVLEGEVFVTGRKKDLIIVGGKNIYPQDLETLAGEVPGVHPGRVAAFGIYNDEAGTEDVVLVAEADVHPRESWPVIAEAVRAHVSKNSAIALRRVEIVGPKWIVKTSSGKVNRGANREKYLHMEAAKRSPQSK